MSNVPIAEAMQVAASTAPGVHAGGAENRRLHEDDVGHRQKGREAGDDFGANGRTVRSVRLKEAVERGCGDQGTGRRPSGASRGVLNWRR